MFRLQEIKQDHKERLLPLPFIDQIFDRLVGKEYYSFLDGYSGYFLIVMTLEDQEKNIFTCLNGIFSFRRVSLVLCNFLATFKSCMMAIFSGLVEFSIKIFMDDFFFGVF